MNFEEPLPVDKFSSELKASLSGDSGEAMLRRINAERLLRLLADEFIEAHQAECIRILPDNRLVSSSDELMADFLFQIDDYDIRAEMLDAPDGTPSLDVSQLDRCLCLLADNPKTDALILVWATDDLLSVPLSVRRIQYLLDSPNRVPDLLSRAEPLPDVLRAVVEGQAKRWETGLGTAPLPAVESVGPRRLFEQAIEDAFEEERRRSYRYPERKLAAKRFPVARERRLILATLGDALDGVSVSKIISRLTHVSRRGGK